MSERPAPGGPGVEAILAPFRGIGPSFAIVIEDADGHRVAGTSDGDVPADSIRRDIVAGPLAGGRVVAWGPSAGTPIATASVASMAVALGIAHTVRSAGIADVAAARRIEQELALGRQLQRSFVGLVGPEIPGYDLACHYEQAYEVGGDFFDVFRRLRRGRPLSVVVADVTGKGIGAAMLMAFARPVIHAAIDNSNGPAEALERTNRVLRERGASLFITAICASLTVSTGRLRVANAGHEPPLLVRHDGSPILPLEGSGPLLGAFAALDLVETVTSLGPGDAVVLYTDGVSEAQDAAGGFFGLERIVATAATLRHVPATELTAGLLAAVRAFAGDAPQSDDITILTLRRLAS